MRALTAREAYRLMDRIGLDYGQDGRTFYATNAAETEVWEFDTKKERDEFIEHTYYEEQDEITHLFRTGRKQIVFEISEIGLMLEEIIKIVEKRYPGYRFDKTVGAYQTCILAIFEKEGETL